MTHTAAGWLAATPTPTPTPAVSAPGGADWQIPKIVPDFSGPGIAGMTSLGNWVAGISLVGAGIVFILGFLIAAFGPRLGFMHAKSIGVGGILGGLCIGIGVAMATSAPSTVGGWFA